MVKTVQILRCGVLLLGILEQATASAVELDIQSFAGSACEGPATLELRCVGEGCVSSAPVTQQVMVPGAVALPLTTVIRARLTRGGCWAPDLLLQPDLPRATMPLWRASILSGKFGPAPPGGPSIATLELAMQLSKEQRTSAFEGETLSAPCTIAQRAWECVVPATPFDARVQAAGYTPWYFWHLAPPTAQVLHVGEQRLDLGASAIGWVELRDRTALPIDVHLRIRTYDAPGNERRDFSLTAMAVRANERGFFQFRNVPLGAYDVSATSGTASTVEPVPVDVDRVAEHKLRAAIQLVDPISLAVHITPPVAIDGQPWKVVLRRAAQGSSLLQPIAESAAAPDGLWSSTTPVGTYVLSVVDSTGSTHHRRVLTVDGTVSTVVIKLERVSIRGTVTAGERPLEATLTFRARSGATVTLQSNEEGSFAGTLPQDGDWSVRVRPENTKMYFAGVPVQVTRTMDGSPVDVNIELPTGRLRGTVTNVLGKGVEADVQVWQDTRLLIAAASSTAGEFDVIGLPAEAVAVRAIADAGQSPLVPVTIRDEGESTVDLVIAKDGKVSGHLQTRSGRPASGALIRYTSSSFLEQRETTAGPSGEFSLSIPNAAPFVDLVIMAAGVPSTLARIERPRRDDFLQLMLDDEPAVLMVLLGGTRSWPYVGRQGALVALPSLFPPRVAGPPPGLSREGFETKLAPGIYHVCPTAVLNGTCKEVLLAPHTQTVVDFSKPAQ